MCPSLSFNKLVSSIPLRISPASDFKVKLRYHFVSSVSMYYNFYYSCNSNAFFLGLNYLSVTKEKHKNNSKFFNKYLLKEYLLNEQKPKIY